MSDLNAMSKKIPITWVYPKEIIPRVAQNFICSYQDGLFSLAFFEVWQPEIVGTPEERAKTLNEIKTAEVRCVARIVVTPNKLREILRAINENINSVEQLKQQEKSESQE